MLQTACATTATATILSPCSQATCEISPRLPMPQAKAMSASAGGKRTWQAGARQAKNEADLTARGSWLKLTKRIDVGVRSFIEPLAAFDEFSTEIAQVRDWPAEARDPEPKEDPEHI